MNSLIRMIKNLLIPRSKENGWPDEMHRQIDIIRDAFDVDFYLSTYSDIANAAGIDPLEHYCAFGWKEGRDPSSDFSTRYYLHANPDVREAEVNPFVHYHSHGKDEGRSPNATIGEMRRQMDIIRDVFDVEFYLSTYSDIANTAGIDPLEHYCAFGWKEGRDPSSDFSTRYYLYVNPDVHEAGVNPFVHYLSCGKDEGRTPNTMFDKSASSLSPLFSPVDWPLDDPNDPDTFWAQYERLFPYGVPCGPIEAPLVLFSSMGGAISDDRINEALLMTKEKIYVMASEKTELRVLNKKELARVVTIYTEKTPIVADLLGLVAQLTSETVGMWDTALTPSVSAWSFLSDTLQRNPGCNFAGPAVCSPDGMIWRSGVEINKGADNAAFRDTGFPFYHPFVFRERPSVAIEPLFGLYRRRNLSYALMTVDASEPLPNGLVAGMMELPQSLLIIQGCAIVFIPCLQNNSLSPPLLMEYMRAPIEPKQELIVYVDSVPPMPDQDAGSVTAWNFLEIFKARGAEVLFYSTSQRKWDDRYVLALAARGIVCLTDRVIKNYDSACYLIGNMYQPDYIKMSFILTRVYAGGEYVEVTRERFPKASVIFNTVDLHGLRELREARLVGSAAREFSAYATYARERSIIQMSDATILLSEAEMTELTPTLGHANLKLIPMINEFSRPKTSFQDRRGLMFVGGFAHYPNVDAVEYIIDELWAAIHARNPDLTLDIVGPHFPDSLQLRLPEGVRAFGFVEDLSAKLEEVRLTIAPLRYGAGIKGKIGTSLAHGVPCVATSLAAEGMGLEVGKEILVADTPEDFAEAVATMHDDAELWARVSKAGFDFCEARYSRRAVAAQLNDLLDEVA